VSIRLQAMKSFDIHAVLVVILKGKVVCRHKDIKGCVDFLRGRSDESDSLQIKLLPKHNFIIKFFEDN
jgi:hypothetical protein